MKPLKSYLFAALAATLLPLLTSCLSDNDDDVVTYRALTQQEKSTILFNMAGDYSGKAFFINNEQKDDSLVINYSISSSDSVLTITDFDMKMLEQPAKIGSEAMSQIVGNAGKTQLRLVLHPYFNTAIGEGYYTFTYSNDNPTTHTYNDGETDHSIAITMAASVDINLPGGIRRYYSMGEYYKKKMQMNLVFKSLMVDGQQFSINAIVVVSATQL